ncbi:MAG: efflux RND transporter periplasmic adaptor subunit [Acidobacteriota bacterium]
MKRQRATALIVVLLAAWMFSTGCTSGQKAAANQEGPAKATVAVAKASPEDLARNLTLTAEFRPWQEIEVMSKVSGYVRSITVDIGDHVRQGQLLATLEVPEMTDESARAKAALQRSEAQVEQARDEVKHAESGYQIAHLSYQRLDGVMKSRPGLVAQQEVDDAHARDTSADAQLSAARSNLAAAEQQVGVSRAELARLDTMFAYTKVTAPFDGIISKRYADTGSMIQAGTASQTQAMPLVRLSDNSTLRLILPVPESAVPTVHVGQQVDVRVPTLNRTFPGRVARFTDRVTEATRSMDTEVDVRNPGLLLIPGMYAEVELSLQKSNRALAVPVTAVDMDTESGKAGTGTVLVVNGQNRLEKRTVTIGMETASRIEIRSGVSDGEMLVIGNRASLQPGQEVSPKLTDMTAGK